MNKINKIGRTSWDSFAYALMMAHNVYCHIVAVQRANNLVDIERAKPNGRPDWRHWRKLNAKQAGSDEYSDWVPRNILYFDRFVEELFETTTKEDAFAMIEQASPFLRSLDGARLRGGNAQNTFTSLFDIEDVTSADEVNIEDPDDDALRSLEKGVKE